MFTPLDLIMGGISLGILFFGIFMVFGTYIISQLLEHGDVATSSETDHDFDHDLDHDVDHDFDHGLDHDVDHDFDHGLDHDVDHDFDHGLDHDMDHHLSDGSVSHDCSDPINVTDVDLDSSPHTFEFSKTPLGALLGTILLSYGGIGILMYFFLPTIPIFFRILTHVLIVIAITWIFSRLFKKLFLETGTFITLRSLIGTQVTATTDIVHDFGEIRVRTIAGFKRYPARPYFKEKKFPKGELLYIVNEFNGFALVNDEYR
ncbi:MAG: hypothetical protein ACTSRW_09710 [Candidatus Helarchaeota archaeon]